MTSKDKQLWNDYTRGVAAERNKRKTPKPLPKKIALATPLQPPSLPALDHAPRRVEPLPSVMLERNREKALREGEFEIDAKLDLHGLTQSEAFEALARFLHRKVKAGKKILLIVTGKGRGDAGVLKTQLPFWLTQLPEAAQILALRPAAIKHGGSGAFYVLLRRSSRA